MKKYIFILTLLFCNVYLFSQQQNSEIERQEAVINNWYIEVAAGAQILFSTDAENLKFGERITPSFSITGGKWFSPYWGLHLQIDGFDLNGFSTIEGTYAADPLPEGGYGTNDPVLNYSTIRPDGSYRHYIRYMNAHVGIQASAVNLLAGYKESRKWDIIPAAGIGYFNTFNFEGVPASGSLSGTFSLMGKYTIWQNLDMLLEISTTLVPDKFDGRFTNRGCENTLAARIGIAYNFKKRAEYKLLKNLCDLAKSEKKTKFQKNEQTQPIEQKQIVEQAPQVIEKIQVVKEIVWKTDTVFVNDGQTQTKREPFVLSAILFELGKVTPSANQNINYINIAKYLEANPKAKIRLDGYGDKETGSEQNNLRVSNKRVNVIRKILIEKYKIDPARIEGQAIGSNVQPYDKNNWNRVVLVTVIE